MGQIEKDIRVVLREYGEQLTVVKLKLNFLRDDNMEGLKLNLFREKASMYETTMNTIEDPIIINMVRDALIESLENEQVDLKKKITNIFPRYFESGSASKRMISHVIRKVA